MSAHYWTWPVPDTVAVASGVSQIWCQPADEGSCIPGWLAEGPIVLELVLLTGGQDQGLVGSQGWCGLSGEWGWGPGDTGAGALPLASEVRSWDLWLEGLRVLELVSASLGPGPGINNLEGGIPKWCLPAPVSTW